MRTTAALLLALGTGCGEGSAIPLPPRPPGPEAVAPAPPPPAPVVGPARGDELHPLRLSVLQGRLTPDTVFYFHDPRMDPEGTLGDQPRALRDIYRPAGTYLMRFWRKGYKPVDVEVRLTANGPAPPLEKMELEFVATEELSGRYREAEEALAGGNARKARAALERVRELDERYLRTPEFLRALAELEERLERDRKALEEAAASLHRGDLEGAAKVEALGPRIEEVKAARARFDRAVGRFDVKAAEGELTRLREALTPADPSNRDRDVRVDDLKALRGLLDQFEQICLEPRGARERLADLWDKERIARAEELARDLAKFTRHARYVSASHEPSSLALAGAEAEVRALLRVRYSVPGGESQAERAMIVRFRKADGWRMVDYREAE